MRKTRCQTLKQGASWWPSVMVTGPSRCVSATSGFQGIVSTAATLCFMNSSPVILGKLLRLTQKAATFHMLPYVIIRMLAVPCLCFTNGTVLSCAPNTHVSVFFYPQDQTIVRGEVGLGGGHDFSEVSQSGVRGIDSLSLRPSQPLPYKALLFPEYGFRRITYKSPL